MARPGSSSLLGPLRLLTTAGWSVLISGIGLVAAGLAWSHNESLLVGATLLGVLMAALAWMLRRPLLTVHRTIEPATVEEGRPANAVLRITNPTSRRTPRLAVVDRWDDAPLSLAVSPLGAGTETVVTYAVPTQRRGIHQLGPLSAAYVDPFRLVQAGGGASGRMSYRVWPGTVEVPPLPTGRTADAEGAATAQSARSGVTFHSLREYVPGDDLRQVHWRSSARTGTLLIRQHVLSGEARMVIFVDCRADAYDSDDRFDDVCRVAASLLRAGRRGGRPVELITSPGDSAVVDATGTGFERAMDLLAGLSRSTSDPGPVQLARRTARRYGVASVAVLTGDVSPAHAELLRTLRSRFAAYCAVQLGEPGSIHGLPLPGSIVLQASDLTDFAERWTSRYGR